MATASVKLTYPVIQTKKPVTIVTAFPDTTSIQTKRYYTGQSKRYLVHKLSSALLIKPADLGKEYIFLERPPKGDLETWLKPTNSKEDTAKLTYNHIKLEPDKILSILPAFYSYMIEFRQRLRKLESKIIIIPCKWALYLLAGVSEIKTLQESQHGILYKFRGSQIKPAEWWGLPDDVIIIALVDPIVYIRNKEKEKIFLQDCRRIADYYNAYKQGKWLERITPTENFISTNDFTDIVNKLQELIEHSHKERFSLAADLETSCHHIDTVSMAWSATEGLAIQFSGMNNPSLFSLKEEFILWNLVRELLGNRNVLNLEFETKKSSPVGVELVGQGWIYDAFYLFFTAGIFAPAYNDTIGMSKVMFPLMEKDLSFLSSIYCTTHIYWKDQINKDTYTRRIYAIRDSVATWEVAETQKKLLSRRNDLLREFYRFTQRELFPATLRFTFRGMNVDKENTSKVIVELNRLIDVHQTWLDNALPAPINPSSPKQMGEFLYTNMQIIPPNIKGVKIGSTSEAVLHHLYESEPIVAPVIARVLDQRSLVKFRGDVSAKSDDDGKMRTKLDPYGTNTYRYSSQKTPLDRGTNLQNRSKGGKTEFGTPLPNLRSNFIPPPAEELDFLVPESYTGSLEWDIGDLDLDSADMRIVAARSGCVRLNEWFSAGKKPYVELMKNYYQDPDITKKHPQYRNFKGVGHGSNYLGKANGIARNTGLDEQTVLKIQNWYFDQCPEIREWHRWLIERVNKGLPIVTVFGAELYVNSTDVTAYQKAAALEPQSTVATIIKKGIVSMDMKENPALIHPLMDVHDSCVFAFRRDLENVKERMKKHFVIPLQYPTGEINIPVDYATSPNNWGECG